jgi:type I restriction enzyme S subunit
MGWSNQTLGDYCEVIAGQSPEGKYYNTDGQGLPFYQGKKEFGDRFIGAPQKWTTKVTKEAIDGDILMSVRAPVGPINFSTQKICIGRGLASIRPSTKLNKDFLFYYLLSKQDEIVGNEGAVFASINKAQIEALSFSYVDITEQKRIVALLDTVFADLEQTRAKTEQNLKNARELFDSYLQQVFSQKGEGWAEKTLKEASLDFGRGKSKHRPRNDVSLYGGEYPFVQTGDVRNCEHLITKYSKTYNKVGLAQSKLWPKGTICITIAANIAETGILDFDSCFPDSVIGVVVNPEVTTIPYVEFLLQSFKAILQAKSKGSAQANINMGTFEKLHFPFPNINKQNEIVDSLNELMLSVQQLEVIYQKKLNSIDELKKSILQKAFNGELTTSAD